MLRGNAPGNVTALDGGNKPNIMKEAIRNMTENLPMLIEHAALMAKLHRAKFLALKAEGFSDQESLELCKVVF